jgi:hypothetical protein
LYRDWFYIRKTKTCVVECKNIAQEELTSFHEAINLEDKEKLFMAMHEKFKSFMKNETWVLKELPLGQKT